MGWKDWKYSTKGAIIAIAILFVYNLIGSLGRVDIMFLLEFFYTLPVPLIFGGLIGSIYGDVKEKKYNTNMFRIKIILLAVLIFLIFFAYNTLLNLR